MEWEDAQVEIQSARESAREYEEHMRRALDAMKSVQGSVGVMVDKCAKLHDDIVYLTARRENADDAAKKAEVESARLSAEIDASIAEKRRVLDVLLKEHAKAKAAADKLLTALRSE